MLSVILGQDQFLSPLSGSGIRISRSLSLPCDVTGGESWWMSWWWQLAIWQAGNGSRFLIAPNRMWACKLLTWDARRAEGLGKSPGGCGGGRGGGGGAAGWEEGTGRDLVISGTVSVSLADRRKKMRGLSFIYDVRWAGPLIYFPTPADLIVFIIRFCFFYHLEKNFQKTWDSCPSLWLK